MRVSLLFQFVCKKHMRVSNIPHLFKRCLHPTPFCSRSAANLVSSVGDVVTAVCTKRRGSRTLRKKRSHATAAGCFHCCAEKGAEHCHAVLLVVGFGICRNRRRLLQNRATLLRLLLAGLLSCCLCTSVISASFFLRASFPLLPCAAAGRLDFRTSAARTRCSFSVFTR